jgi:hypothetical protein
VTTSPEKARKGTRRAARPARFRSAWIVIAGLYLATVWFDGIGSTFPVKVTPRPWLYFAQVAALFTTAAPKVIDYRAEGWSCADRRWVELDVRPYFRIDADNKENRFQRALQFYRKDRVVMRALEDYLLRRNTAVGGAQLGGVRFSSLRLPYPAPGEHVSAYEHHPLASYPSDQRHDWYFTPKSRRLERCGQLRDPAAARDDDSDRARAKDKDKDNAKDKDKDNAKDKDKDNAKDKDKDNAKDDTKDKDDTNE